MKKLMLLMALIFLFTGIVYSADSTDVKDDAKPKEEKSMDKFNATVDKIEGLELTALPTGVKYYDIIKGEGKECKLGSKVQVHYTLWFADENGEKGTRFQSSKDFGKPFDCTLGYRLIQGWSDGMVGMKEGGKRLLVVPPDQGYGKGGGPIPANATLIFEIEYLKALD